MIPLRLKVNVEGDGGREFIVKVLRDHEFGKEPFFSRDLLNTHGAFLVAELPESLVFRFSGGYLHVPGASFPDLEGDVLFIDPRRSIAHRWIRARSPHNTLVVTERCDQLCVMCSQPPKSHHVDLFKHFLTAVSLAPLGMEVGISGGEPTLYKQQLFALLRSAATMRPDIRFHVLSNAQHFREEDVQDLRDPQLRNVCWGVPLYAADGAIHDSIVGKEGAYAQLLSSLALLLRAAVSIELRTVIMQPNLTNLPELARFVVTHLGFVRTWALMQLENIGFARMRWEELFVDHSLSFDPIADAIDLAIAGGINVQLYNCPLCSIPANYRNIAGQTISDWKQRYLDMCSSCRERQQCCGFFEWYQEERGFRGISPL